MKNYPLISIALATYNGESFLAAQLDSLLAQDYPHLEIVVSDDGSSDKTWIILQNYIQKSSIPIYIYQNTKTKGFVMNFANVLSYCKGDYIALCDQDDIWYSHKITRLYNYLQEQKALMVYSNANIIDAQGNSLHVTWYHGFNKSNNPLSGQIPESLYLYSYITGCMTLLDAKLLQKVTINEQVYYHDWFLGWAAARYGKIAFLNENLMDYRRHSNTLTARIKKKTWIPKNINIYKIYQDYKENTLKTTQHLQQLYYIKQLEITLGVDTKLIDIVINYLNGVRYNLFIKKQTQAILQYDILTQGNKRKKLGITHKYRLFKSIVLICFYFIAIVLVLLFILNKIFNNQ